MVHKGNFQEYYGYTFAGRAQFSASSRLCINSAPEHHIKHIPAGEEVACEEIVSERKKRRFEDEDDLKKRRTDFANREMGQ
ncbi:hypothetical protein BX616_007755 [Lobosporangium transversale]|nr:hypothetical protein BX616_007755 [Lobosporangium transversale]